MNSVTAASPRVSIIVPNYNHARFLEKRLSSILQQTYRDTELILLDDASTDGSPEVLSRYEGQPNTRIILNRTNSECVFKQWNLGLREARGEYVWIAESDDYAAPEFLQRMVACLDAHPKVGLAYSQSRIVDEHDADLGVGFDYYRYLDDRRWFSDFVNDGRDECARYLILRNTIPNASAVVFRRAAYLAAGPANESMRLAGDWLQWARILMISDVAYLAEPLNYYRTHGGTVRSGSLETGRSLREFLAVTAFIRRHVAVPDEVRHNVNEQWIDMWRDLGGDAGRIIAAQQVAILWQALKTDPRLLSDGLKTILRAKWQSVKQG